MIEQKVSRGKLSAAFAADCLVTRTDMRARELLEEAPRTGDMLPR